MSYDLLCNRMEVLLVSFPYKVMSHLCWNENLDLEIWKQMVHGLANSEKCLNVCEHVCVCVTQISGKEWFMSLWIIFDTVLFIIDCVCVYVCV